MTSSKVHVGPVAAAVVATFNRRMPRRIQFLVPGPNDWVRGVMSFQKTTLASQKTYAIQKKGGKGHFQKKTTPICNCLGWFLDVFFLGEGLSGQVICRISERINNNFLASFQITRTDHPNGGHLTFPKVTLKRPKKVTQKKLQRLAPCQTL